MAKTGRKKNRISVKDMRHRHDPMIRFYETTQDWLQERGRPIVLAIGIIAGLIVIYSASKYFIDYRKSKAEAAFAQAVEKFNAPVQDSAVVTTAPTAMKTYSDETTKWQESAEAFDRLANDYSGYYGAIGHYYAGVCYLHLDGGKDKGISLLQQAADKNDQPTSDLARLAIAEYYASGGDTQNAISTYEKLLNTSTNIKPAVYLGLGRAYEKAGDTEKAVEAYLEAAKPDRSAPAGAEAEKRLTAIAPDRLKDLPAPTTTDFQP
ncbi:MAG TPA: tetratricopeptide repeat protein [Blastocatellia bacterium]